MDHTPSIAPNNECSFVAPGGTVVSLSPETGVIIPPSTDPAVVRQWITDLTNGMLATLGEGVDFPIKHTFLNGMYMREMFIPKGSMLIGKVHRLACVNIVSTGDISVLTEHGSARVGAGYTGVSQPGIQKVGYAHEDTVFINVFRTDETDPEKIEDVVAFENYAAVDRALAALSSPARKEKS